MTEEKLTLEEALENVTKLYRETLEERSIRTFGYGANTRKIKILLCGIFHGVNYIAYSHYNGILTAIFCKKNQLEKQYRDMFGKDYTPEHNHLGIRSYKL